MSDVVLRIRETDEAVFITVHEGCPVAEEAATLKRAGLLHTPEGQARLLEVDEASHSSSGFRQWGGNPHSPGSMDPRRGRRTRIVH